MTEEAARISQRSWHRVQRLQDLAPVEDEAPTPVIGIDLEELSGKLLPDLAQSSLTEDWLSRDLPKQQKAKVLGVGCSNDAGQGSAGKARREPLAGGGVQEASFRQHADEDLLHLGQALVGETLDLWGLGALTINEAGEIRRVELRVEREGLGAQDFLDELADKTEAEADGDEQQMPLIARVRPAEEIQFLRSELLKAIADFTEQARPAGVRPGGAEPGGPGLGPRVGEYRRISFRRTC